MRPSGVMEMIEVSLPAVSVSVVEVAPAGVKAAVPEATKGNSKVLVVL